jgi:uncharacterized protein YndB with AHSA1/START domain
MTAPRGSVRRHVRIDCPADAAWSLLGDPERLPEWWPGIVSAQVDGSSRVVTTGAGLPIPEAIVTNDRLARRFQYRITGPVVQEHLSTLDVLDLEDGTCVAVYGADAVPATMALVIAGAAGSALEKAKSILEGAPSSL